MLSVCIDKLWLAFYTLRNIANNSHDAECIFILIMILNILPLINICQNILQLMWRGGKAGKLAECCLLLRVALDRV